MQTPASAAGASGRPESSPGETRSSDPPTPGAGRVAARGAWWWRAAANVVLVIARATLAIAFIALLAVVVLYLRLLQGPIVVPRLAELAAERVNETTDGLRVSAADAVFSLGDGDSPAGLRFREVEVRTVDGQRLFAAPRLAARFHLSDLVHGRVRPVRIRLIEPEVQIIRAEDGRLRFGLGDGAGISVGASGVADGDAGADVLGRVIDGFVGDAPPVPALARLERVAIVRANIVYDDRLGDGGWQTENATLRIVRLEDGARATLEIDALRDEPKDPAVRVVAERTSGAGRTELSAQFGRVASSELARQSRRLDWLELIGGTLEGRAEATLEADGRLSRLEGIIVAEDGTIRGLGAPMPFDLAQLDFRGDPALERLTVDDFRVSAAALHASLRGFADMRRAPDGTLRGLAGQFDVGALHVDLPEVFADPLAFDGGRFSASWSLEEERVDVIGARLASGDLSFTVEGNARATADGWVTDLRAAAEGMTVDDLVAFWPLAAAVNARTWIDENIPAGAIDRLTAQMRIGQGDPKIALDFDYSGLRARYVDEMSPIEAASGTGHVTYNELFLGMDAGHVEAVPGARIDLGGSSMAIAGFWGKAPPAEIALKAEGPTQAVLALIDQQPLRLVSKLGRDLEPVAGRTRVEADMTIPLLKDLRLEQIGVGARAALRDVATGLELDPGRRLDVAAERLELVADTESLRLSGEARVDGAPVVVDWRENYASGQGGRTLALSGAATPALLSSVGAADLPIDGAPRFDLAIRQEGDGPVGLTLDADLEPARVEIAALDWVKARGAPGRLRAEGTMGSGLDISSLRLDGPALEAEGAVRLDADGRLERAEFRQIRTPELGSFAATLDYGADGVMEVNISGARLDLSDRIGEAGGGSNGAEGGVVEPVRLGFDVGRLQLSEKVALTPAEGRVQQTASGGLTGRIEGLIGGAAAVAIGVDIPGSGPGRVRIVSPNAGAALRAANLYPGAEGGELTVDITTGTRAAPGLSGEARIEDVMVRSQSTFRNVLRDGGLAEAEAEVASGGLRFRSVVVPFTYRGDLIRLTDAIAVSPLLAVKVNGTVNEATDRLDLRGVLSPAYALTGALNEVPLIGQILGGRGEGILAMTFRLTGYVGDPQFSVNPLSVLAPGFLRRVFTAPAGEVSEDFRDRITREDR